MQYARLASAALLAGAAYIVWKQSNVFGMDADYASSEDLSFPASFDEIIPAIESFSETVLHTLSPFVGVSMSNAKYEAALLNPANARIIGYLRQAESNYGIPSGLLVRQAWQESRFNPSAVNKLSGAKGLLQFMDATASEWGVNAFDAASSADGGGRYMVWLYDRTGSWPLALAAYNWGVGNVLRKGFGKAPKETRDYVAQIGADVGLT